MFSRIAVPLDGSAFSEYALPWAIEIARRAGAGLELVHVHVPDADGDGLTTLTPYQFEGVTRRYAERDRIALHQDGDALQRMAEDIARDSGLAVTARVVVGRIDSALEAEADAFGADLIVMGTHGRRGLSRIRHGSIADAIVRHGHQPVLLVQPPVQMASGPEHPVFRNVLVPVDGSMLSRQILPYAIALAHLFGSRVRLLHVQIEGIPPFGDTEIRYVADSDEVLRQIAMDVAGLGSSNLEVVQARHPAVAILDAAERHGSDLIAMATHGRGGISRVLMGSTTDLVLGHTHLPLLTWRPSKVRLMEQVVQRQEQLTFA